jgi:HK97 family phage major capsid protein
VTTPLRQLGEFARDKETANGAREFMHVARRLAKNGGNWDLALKEAQYDRALPRIQEVLKTAATPGTLAGWGQPLAPYQQLQDSFLLSLRSVSAFEQMLQFMKIVPVGLQNISVATSAATATTVNEAMVKPVTKMALSTLQVTPKKTTAIVAVSKELLQFASSNIFAQELTNAVAEAVDASFVSEITSGIAPTTSAGGGPIAILTDLTALLASLTIGANSKVFLLVSSDIAKSWSVKTTIQGGLLFPAMTPNGGEVQGLPVIVTSAVSGQIVAADASQLIAASGNIILDVSEQTTLQFDTTPDSPSTSATNLVSLWQMNFAGIRATRYWAIGRTRSACVAVVSGVSYVADSPA